MGHLVTGIDSVKKPKHGLKCAAAEHIYISIAQVARNGQTNHLKADE
jgi:hypothetical protein